MAKAMKTLEFYYPTMQPLIIYKYLYRIINVHDYFNVR